MSDTWVIRTNIERYRQLLATELDEAMRREVSRLLAQAEGELATINAAEKRQ